MSNTNENAIDAMREELQNLRGQIENIVKTAEDKKSEIGSDLVEKLSNELEKLRKNAGDQAHRLYNAGQAGFGEVEETVRKNPLASLAVAFGAGCILSCLFRQLR